KEYKKEYLERLERLERLFYTVRKATPIPMLPSKHLHILLHRNCVSFLLFRVFGNDTPPYHTSQTAV
ncbi:MAG: hypothetical protein IKM54_01135, partial [Butyricicoccus sp.]|nr:hypothetical protein [Butyricicoccus sp.]